MSRIVFTALGVQVHPGAGGASAPPGYAGLCLHPLCLRLWWASPHRVVEILMLWRPIVRNLCRFYAETALRFFVSILFNPDIIGSNTVYTSANVTLCCTV